jgi:N-acetylglutamate synthase-like GNAT family acetyltransferase
MSQKFSKDERKQANESNAINVIPDVMSDTTGKQLIQALLDLADKMGVTIEYQ